MLISAVLIASVMSVALTGKQTGGKADRKMIAVEEARRLTQILNDYVTGDSTTAPTTLLLVPGSPAWSWPAGITDTCTPGPSPCYALRTGSHTLTGFLPAWFAAPPYNATAVYYVGSSGIIPGLPWVNVTIRWSDP